MKKIVLLLIIFAVSLSLEAQISLYSNITKDISSPCITIYNTHALSDDNSFGLTYFALVNQNWAEVQIGFYKSLDWFSWGLSLGVEQNDRPLRTGAIFFTGKNKNSFLAFLEKGFGQNNYWYKITALHRFNDDINFGIRAWRYVGLGPLMEFKIENTKLSLWFMSAYNFETDMENIIFGINYKI